MAAYPFGGGGRVDAPLAGPLTGDHGPVAVLRTVRRRQWLVGAVRHYRIGWRRRPQLTL